MNVQNTQSDTVSILQETEHGEREMHDTEDYDHNMMHDNVVELEEEIQWDFILSDSQMLAERYLGNDSANNLTRASSSSTSQQSMPPPSATRPANPGNYFPS